MRAAKVTVLQLQFGKKLHKDRNGNWTMIPTKDGPTKSSVRGDTTDDDEVVRITSVLIPTQEGLG
jgi:hypothetical protein